MARRFLLFSVMAVSLSMPAWFSATTVEAGPKTPPAPGACKDDLSRANRDLAVAREAVKRAQAAEADARAELEQLRAAERARVKRLQSVTGVAADKLQ